MLPAHFRVPDLPAHVPDVHLARLMDYPIATARGLAPFGHRTTVEVDPALKPVWWSAYPILVDGREVVIDVGDDCMLSPHASGHGHWLKYQYVSPFQMYPYLGSFPQVSFYDWAEYHRLRGEVRYDPAAPGAMPFASRPILHMQARGHDRGPLGPGPRRDFVHGLLRARFGGQVAGELLPQAEFWRLAGACSVSVHAPGSYNNCLDRGQWQLMALGVCTVSPTLYSYCGDGPPEPGVHYVRCRDDYADLGDRVAGCLADPARCAAIGGSAAEFFRERGTPEGIWGYVARRLAAKPPA